MTYKEQILLNDCIEFIKPYDNGGNEAAPLIIRLYESLKQSENVVLDGGSKCTDTQCPKCKSMMTLVQYKDGKQCSFCWYLC